MKAQDKLRNEVAKLRKQEGNSQCADCREDQPMWCSYSLGIFICEKCCVVHRSMGTHISRVKSLSLDNFTPGIVDHLRRTGNTKSNAMYEACKPAAVRGISPSSGYHSRENWIRAKYESKSFYQVPKVNPKSLNHEEQSPQSLSIKAAAPTRTHKSEKHPKKKSNRQPTKIRIIPEHNPEPLISFGISSLTAKKAQLPISATSTKENLPIASLDLFQTNQPSIQKADIMSLYNQNQHQNMYYNHFYYSPKA
eukprot:TRINITY_DN20615_c0_g1_i1.p1 TRINITY_DN20615_c0_g1~~TRINITY_DN20615_c0_g1_i1.p1  ORF type:complete len:274 (+),score=27.86 TRINITY_DN20615_c0_g1_i1:72-824(+)